MRFLILVLCMGLFSACERRAPAARLEPQAPDPVPLAPIVHGPAAEPVAPNQPQIEQSVKAEIPKGCDLNLSGEYHFAKKLRYRYLVEDDGTRIVVRRLEPEKQSKHAKKKEVPANDNTPGAHQTDRKELGDDSEMNLERTGTGFVGFIKAGVRVPSGKTCQVSFQAQIIACSANSISIRSEDSLAVDESCTARKIDSETATEKLLLKD